MNNANPQASLGLSNKDMNNNMATLVWGLLAAIAQFETITYAHVWDLFVAVGGRQDDIVADDGRWAGISLRCYDESVLDVRMHAGTVVSMAVR